MIDPAWFSISSIGVDEAGRGCLAGPVVAAAVVLDPRNVPSGITDSKKIKAADRERLDVLIRKAAVAFAISFVSNERIDEVNILQATYDAMHAAINDVVQQMSARGLTVDHLLIDGNRFRAHEIPSTTIIDGDEHNLAIGAASILAKVARDRFMMQDAQQLYPEYGFAKHKGYGTAAHRQAINEHGVCPLHRNSFLKNIPSRS